MKFSCTYVPDAGITYDMGCGSGYAAAPGLSGNEDLRDSWPGDYYSPPAPTFLMDVPNGNYHVDVKMSIAVKESITALREGVGHLRLLQQNADAPRQVTASFAVHVDNGGLMLASGAGSVMEQVEIRRDTDISTLFLAGDSTVTDQASSKYPYSGWGQMLGLFLKDGLAIANHACSGRSARSFIQEDRLTRIAKKLRKGDFLLIQFAHNDEKETEDGAGPFTTYPDYLQQYIHLAREKEAYPVLVSPMHRRFFEADGSIRNTHGDYIEAMRQLALQEEVPFVDLAGLSKAYFEALGDERTKQVFLWAVPGQYANLPEGAEDNTHFTEAGAVEIARLVARGIREAGFEPLSRHLITEEEAAAVMNRIG
ncbi:MULTISPECIES: rhamnogalacturonan acetylesterase [unclassified Paenibacillus]|uniref:rhamnogalacturonan acetylesterase n=1 Tax=unclassified Paenibacillus TaxID=185978 RepID=UPI00240515E0|nr:MULTISPECIES: rhamnogalacturonan acetylesterase [unclassified Paenibacillus]MDF9841668.1 lysophospholipase L1-like esterase [Paenibacillus sp. PastF-2]MDF9848220.1 lysophospholipase L1-like esterase [Paenibacillus sp. PastM-2]MDF9854827.1 lysophospholipase L1-like esterase [Paenibacillus sp. PastF-1]MDH6480097.1 lysophospholipase L1-like esterase [Paenibacillus sp. PastH-2]MDH6507530.1 lysophospholipase L1-like esterase [Paenibacillus sp. PastM-3]